MQQTVEVKKVTEHKDVNTETQGPIEIYLFQGQTEPDHDDEDEAGNANRFVSKRDTDYG